MDDKDYPDLTALIGKRVIHRDSEPDGSGAIGVGIIVHAWVDPYLDATDCYVAFYGDTWPAIGEKPKNIPSVLRFLLSSLEDAT